MLQNRLSPRPVRARTLVVAISSARRFLRRCSEKLMLLGGWTWVAAASLIGFEAFEMLFGAFVLAPELLPLVIIALALGWYFRERLRALSKRARIRVRAARAHRSQK